MTLDDGPPADGRDAEERILTFIRTELVGPEVSVGADDELLNGLLDSVAALRLATFVAEKFGLEIRPSDYVIENFRSAAAVADYVRRAGER